MLIWFGLIAIAAGIACLPFDRRAAHFFYDRLRRPLVIFMGRTTNWAKGGYWLALAIIAYFGSQIAMHFKAESPVLHILTKSSLAFIACLAVGSAVLHVVKRVFARRRPRDELEMGLYGFRVLNFDTLFTLNAQFSSFPSGHALTIMCVAIVAACVWPHLALLWFLVALWLGFTRAFLTEHFLSDVFIGVGIALIASRETLVYFFPAFGPGWF